MRRIGIVGLCASLAACLSEPVGLDAPSIDAADVMPGPHNVLSAIVAVRARNADSVAVRILLDGDAASVNVTPAVEASPESAQIPVIGLLPQRRYVLHAIAYGAGGTTVGEPLEFTTDALPPDLPRYTTSGSDPSPGYVVFAAAAPSPYGIVIDNTGRVVWYRRFANGPGLSFMAQPNGRYFVRPITPDPTDIEPWLELDALGNVTDTFGCANGLPSRLHDLIAEPDDGYWLMCDESRTMDLTAVGGVGNARVMGTGVQHIAADGTLLFQWSPFDHFAITDVDLSERIGANVNWTHGNSLDFDVDGNLLVSFRNLGEITKIDARTGAVIWRLGGNRNQFTFDGTPMPAFSRQHSVRAGASGALLLLDNLGNPAESRAEHYELDERARTARLIQSHAAVPAVVTQIGGSVQGLPGGRTLVSFGTTGRVEEYDAAGRVVWRIEGNAGYVFRAQRIASLYVPGAGTSR